MVEIGVIQDIEELCAELQTVPFFDPDVLQGRKIPGRNTGSALRTRLYNRHAISGIAQNLAPLTP